MSTLIHGEGARPCRLMIVGERPGVEEHSAGRPFVGPAGKELWAHVWKILRLSRSDFFVTNLVRTFSTAPPTREEIRDHWGYLVADLQRVQPEIIITIGYHAARALLPQFQGVKGDYFHGLAFPFTYGRVRPRTAVVVPCCHSSAALRQPDRYQNQLSDDLRAVRRVIGGGQNHFVSRPCEPYRVGLAGFGQPDLHVGVDTEGSIRDPQAVTGSAHRNEAFCIELQPGQERTPFLKAALEHAKALRIHHAKYDLQVLHALGIMDVRREQLPRVDDTMLMAYLLGEPQSLKVLAYRHLGLPMSEYADLVEPIDEAQVRATLEAQLARWQETLATLEAEALTKATTRARLLGTRVTKKATAMFLKRLRAKSGLPENRVISGLRRMLTVTEAAGADDDA